MNDSFIRAFVAIELPDEVKALLAAEQKALADGLSGIKWVNPEGIHLTLKFLGNVPKSRLTEIERALKEATAGTGPMELCLAGRGAFPDSRRPEVVWLGLGGQTSKLAVLFQKIERSMTGQGVLTASDAGTRSPGGR
jgi:2'-5' RNA ligase